MAPRPERQPRRAGPRRRAPGVAVAAASAAALLAGAAGRAAFAGARAPASRPPRWLGLGAAGSGEGGAADGAPAAAKGAGAPEGGAPAPGWGAGLFPGVRPDLVPDAPVEDSGFVDEEALREQNRFPIPEEGLVQLAKAFLVSLFSDPAVVKSRMASDFRFVAPVVPAVGSGLSADELCTALGQFDILEAVPDLDPQQYGFRTDPFEPSRVWFTARGRGTMTGTLAGGLPPTGRSYEGPPQMSSLTFNEAGEVTKMTIGYVIDKEVGTSGGLGGIFGILYAIGYGLPFPEAQPWRPSPLYVLLTKTGNLLRGLRNPGR